MHRVAVILTGGTITMREDATAGGLVPSLRGPELLDGLELDADGIAAYPVDWGLVPGTHLRFIQVLEIARVLADELNKTSTDGAVIVQGTDNIEETAFAWDLMPLPRKPIVVVGSMRGASELGYEGRGNLRDAIVAAASSELSGQGVVVVMDGEIHGADDVSKTHSHAYGTFKSLNVGTLGDVRGGTVRLHRARRPYRLPDVPAAAAKPVGLVRVSLDMDFPVLADGVAWAGVVVEGAGAGNTPADLLEEVFSRLDAAAPIVLASRCRSGAPAVGYAFPGGSTQWWEKGAYFAGYLGGLKAKVALSLALGANEDADGLRHLFESFGGGRRPRVA